MRISVAVKHSSLILFSVVVTAASLSLTFMSFLKQRLAEEQTKRGSSTARQLAYLAAPLLLGNDVAKLAAAVERFNNEPDVLAVTVLDHQGRRLSGLESKNHPEPHRNWKPRLGPGHWLEPPHSEVFAQPCHFGGVLVGAVVVRLSRLPLQQALSSAAWYVVLVTVLVAGVVLLLGFLSLRHTIRPLNEVIAGTRRLAAGDFSTRLQVDANDEIGELAESFNSMAARTELFFRYLDKSIAERLADNENLARPGGRLQSVTVLFGDMRGFTALANRCEPSEVVWILNFYFHIFFRLVHRFQGVVDKTMGDAVMAFYESGVRRAEPAAAAAVLTAVCMRGAVWTVKQLAQLAQERGQQLRLQAQDFGFSVATGRLIVGNVGSSLHMDYTVCGPAVNLAARLQQDTGAGEVLLDRFTALEAGQLLELRQREPIQPKGFARHQQVIPFQVIGIEPETAVRCRQVLQELFDLDTMARALTDVRGHMLEQVELRRWQQEVSRLVELAPTESLV